MPARLRLDQILVERGLADSRAKAQALILAGQVFTGEQRLDKPGTALRADLPIEVREAANSGYVSRGALKLAHGLEHFGFDPAGRVAVDVGASTGGFTDVLLKAGAERVFAVDVGHGQLDWRLRNDPRVVALERTNARGITAAEVPDPVGAVVCDASFIGLRTVLPASLGLAVPGAWLIALIKPQFEVGKGRVGKGGVVRDPDLHAEVCARIQAWLTEDMGWRSHGITTSPITGPKGNVEFLIGATRS
ncbi:TlyA family RNA methyltransferase [Marinivivus vitaminiproducens]|uniref:TlyA family RNA methyltransferase n=1 Tax=Marinivivus vitaminiproducens TaxID=3035935 RepID=UPI0027A660BB|nr:TlyA family RNA methyltransferase [Geminicoccaceae bacterium SCSIO 64248]